MDWDNDTYKTKYRLQAAARKLFRWHPIKKQAELSLAVRKYFYQCPDCKLYFYKPSIKVLKRDEEQFFVDLMDLDATEAKLHLDHIDPVVDPKTGFTTWENYYNRLFCCISNLVMLCCKCHKVKTKLENDERRRIRNETKNNKK